MAFKTIKNAILFIVVVFTLNGSPVAGQLQQDLRDVFEGMLDDLDDDIRENFQKAIDDDTAEVEFSAEQFLRFRADPINPFEGIEDIDPADVDGNVILKFELPSMRNRTKSILERQNSRNLRQLNPIVASVGASTVSVKSKGREVALGIVVQSNGLVLTKASEISDQNKITCLVGSGDEFSADIIATNKLNDLALLKINAGNLTPIQWSNEQPVLGSFLLTNDEHGKVLFMGSYSVTPRSTAIGKRALLGVRPETTTAGVQVSDIRAGTAAAQAGLKNGDVITKLNDVVMRDQSDLVNEIRKHQPGDEVEIQYLRGNTPGVTVASLAAANISGERAAEYKMMNRLGAIPSRRADGFPFVFQHDTPLFPEQCGGPVVDLRGNVVGINIARNGRAATYAIPSGHVKTILAEMLRKYVAVQNRNAEAGGRK